MLENVTHRDQHQCKSTMRTTISDGFKVVLNAVLSMQINVLLGLNTKTQCEDLIHTEGTTNESDISNVSDWILWGNIYIHLG